MICKFLILSESPSINMT